MSSPLSATICLLWSAPAWPSASLRDSRRQHAFQQHGVLTHLTEGPKTGQAFAALKGHLAYLEPMGRGRSSLRCAAEPRQGWPLLLCISTAAGYETRFPTDPFQPREARALAVEVCHARLDVVSSGLGMRRTALTPSETCGRGRRGPGHCPGRAGSLRLHGPRA
jgi:hypothetical protein